jgi:membrane fusion protein (multidrug efflux system)
MTESRRGVSAKFLHILNQLWRHRFQQECAVSSSIVSNFSSARHLAAFLAIASACFGLSACSQSQSAQNASPAAAEVGVVSLNARPLTLSTDLAGRTTAYTIAQIRPQIGGIVQKRVFTEGSTVNAGDLLYQIDPSSYQAAYDSAKATVAKDEATFNAADLKAKRQAALLAIAAISAQDNEDALAARQEAEATLAGARADLETARINLAHTRITAPISGRVETSSVTAGALVTASQDTALTTVQQLDPIYVDIPQSSAEVLELRQALAKGKIKSVGNGEVPIRLKLENGTDYPYQGKLQFTGTTVSTTTGAITLRALVPNPDHLLMPGMYIRASLDTGNDPAAVLVPQQAVSRSSSGQATALVVTRDGHVEQRNLTTKSAIGNNWYVTEGLTTGDRVIVEGAIKVHPGQIVSAVEVPGAASSAPASGTPVALKSAATTTAIAK